MIQLLGRGRPNEVTERELLRFIRLRKFATKTNMMDHFKIGNVRMKRILKALEDKNSIKSLDYGSTWKYYEVVKK